LPVMAALLAAAPIAHGATLEVKLAASANNAYYAPSIAERFGKPAALQPGIDVALRGALPGTFTLSGWLDYNTGDRKDKGGGLHEVDAIATYTSPKLGAGKWELWLEPSLQYWKYPSGVFGEHNHLVQLDTKARRGRSELSLRVRRMLDGTHPGGMSYLPQLRVDLGALAWNGYDVRFSHSVRVPLTDNYFGRHGVRGVDLCEGVSLTKGRVAFDASLGRYSGTGVGRQSGWYYGAGASYRLKPITLHRGAR
jgi:hypothetical protein